MSMVQSGSRIIKVTTPKAKQDTTCVLCGANIAKNEQYTYLSVRDGKRLKGIKCHNECHTVAESLDIYAQNNICEYNYRKFTMAYVKEAFKKSGGDVRRISNVPTRGLTNLALIAIEEYGKIQRVELSEEGVRMYVVLCSVLSVIPNLFDDLVSDLEDKKLYRHNTKFTISKLIKDFEVMGNDVYYTFSKAQSETDAMVMNGMDIYEKIQGDVALDGVDRSMNILIACLNVLKAKFEGAKTMFKMDCHPEYIDLVIKKLSDVVKYDKQPFVQYVADKYCQGEGIEVVS